MRSEGVDPLQHDARKQFLRWSLRHHPDKVVVPQDKQHLAWALRKWATKRSQNMQSGLSNAFNTINIHPSPLDNFNAWAARDHPGHIRTDIEHYLATKNQDEETARINAKKARINAHRQLLANSYARMRARNAENLQYRASIRDRVREQLRRNMSPEVQITHVYQQPLINLLSSNSNSNWHPSSNNILSSSSSSSAMSTSGNVYNNSNRNSNWLPGHY